MNLQHGEYLIEQQGNIIRFTIRGLFNEWFNSPNCIGKAIVIRNRLLYSISENNQSSLKIRMSESSMTKSKQDSG